MESDAAAELGYPMNEKTGGRIIAVFEPQAQKNQATCIDTWRCTCFSGDQLGMEDHEDGQPVRSMVDHPRPPEELSHTNMDLSA